MVLLMKIGICAGIDRLAAAEKIGFDYIEFNAAWLYGLSEEEYVEVKKTVSESGIKPECFNVLLKSDLKIIGENRDLAELKNYLRPLFKRVSEIGGTAVVFGSGAVRRCSEGYDAEKAYAELVEATIVIGQVAADFGITICVEPLNRSETNMINSLCEGARLVTDVNLENVLLLADFYHMRKENEPISEAEVYGKILKHTHIARCEGRTFPLFESEDAYMEFISALKNAGYSERISIEGVTENWEKDAADSLAFLRGII